MVSIWIITAVTTQLGLVFFCCTNCACCVCCACAHLSAGPRWWGWSRYVGRSPCLKQLLYVGRMEEWRSRPCWTATGLWHSSVISSIMLSLKIKKEMVRLVLPCHFSPSMCLLCIQWVFPDIMGLRPSNIVLRKLKKRNARELILIPHKPDPNY